MTESPSSGGFPALTIVDLAPIESAASLDEITRAQLEKANRLYGGREMKAEQILVSTEDEEVDENGEEILRIQPDYLERGRVLDGGGHHVYDVYLYMVDSGTIFARGSTDVVAEVIQFGAQSDDESLEDALDKAMAALRAEPKKSTRKGGNPALDAYNAAALDALAVTDAKKKPGAKKTTAKKAAPKATAAKKAASGKAAPGKAAGSGTRTRTKA